MRRRSDDASDDACYTEFRLLYNTYRRQTVHFGVGEETAVTRKYTEKKLGQTQMQGPRSVDLACTNKKVYSKLKSELSFQNETSQKP